jgi:hypothetical protein
MVRRSVKALEGLARRLIDEGRAAAFRPYGKALIGEWVRLDPECLGIDAIIPSLVQAIAFVRTA